MKYAYFNPCDGRVIQWIDTEVLNYNLPDASLLHECTDAEWAMQHSGEMMVSDCRVKPYQPPILDVKQVRSLKWSAIQSERDRRKSAGVNVDTKWFHSDANSRIQQIGLVMPGINIPACLQWKTMDGSFVTMTPSLALQILVTAAASDQAIFAAAESHRAAMEACSDPSAYDISNNWPSIFGE